MTGSLKSILALIVVGFLAAACGGSSSGGASPRIASMSIGNAATLFTSSSSTFSQMSANAFASSNQTRLFKITEEGFIEEVTYTDEDGEEITNQAAPDNIVSVNDEFLIVQFTFENSYLVNKQTGAAYFLGKVNCGDQFCSPGFFLNSSNFQSAGGSNIYFIHNWVENNEVGLSVYEVNTSNPDEITRQRITPTLDHTRNYIVYRKNQSRWVLYMAGDNHMAGDNGKVVRPNGSLANLPNIERSLWRGADGEIYYHDAENEKIRRFVFNADNGSVTNEEYGDAPADFSADGYLLQFEDRTVIVSTAREMIFEVYNGTDTPNKIADFPARNVNQVELVGNFIYLSGKDNENKFVVYKVDVGTGVATSLADPDTYDIKKLTASGDDTVLFQATRMSDSAKILGKINADDTITVLEAALTSDISILVRVR